MKLADLLSRQPEESEDESNVELPVLFVDLHDLSYLQSKDSFCKSILKKLTVQIFNLIGISLNLIFYIGL